ncbi:diacylglycerol kinase 2-like [Euphorbia lathyris]|uniref:diacylglycerol kinase 2-like n=1 Tax=Euphorbia lathyris TaxID=212925 RepID=UPI00331349B8
MNSTWVMFLRRMMLYVPKFIIFRMMAVCNYKQEVMTMERMQRVCLLQILVASYMGGLDLWQNEDQSYDDFDPQSMHAKLLEVVSISGTWHHGKLHVNYFEKYY